MKQTLLQKSIELNEKFLEALIGPHEYLVKELIELKEEAKSELGSKTPVPDTVNQKPEKPNEASKFVDDAEVQNQDMKPNSDFDTPPPMPESPKKNTNINDLI